MWAPWGAPSSLWSAAYPLSPRPEPATEVGPEPVPREEAPPGSSSLWCVHGAVNGRTWLLQDKGDFLDTLEPLGPLSQMELRMQARTEGRLSLKAKTSLRVLFSPKVGS